MKPDSLLLSAPDRLLADEVAAHLKTSWLGRQCYCFERVTSTMEAARRLALGGAPDGTAVTAEMQTAGRGRMARAWHSAPGLGIWCSMLLPAGPGAGSVALLVAAGIVSALRAYGVPLCAVKWPNDVMAVAWDGTTLPEWKDRPPAEWPANAVASAKKIAGILIETVREPGSRLVVGMGINVRHGETEFPPDLAAHATSLRLCGGKASNRASLLADILREVEKRYDVARYGTAHQGAAMVEEWCAQSLVLGREVTVLEAGTAYAGRALRIQPDGALLVETEGGSRPVYSGSVSLRLSGSDARTS